MIRRARQIMPSSGAHGDETPEYWVTYSDLLVSLLVVFALLLFVALARIERERATTEKARGAVQQTLATTGRAMGAAAAALGDSGSVRYDARTRTLTVRDEVLFAFGSAKLRPEGVALVQAVGKHFVPGLLNDTVVNRNIEAIVVEGHTDTVGSYLSNLNLSQRRAQNVMQTLVDATNGLSYAPRLRELLVASGRSEVEALKDVAARKYNDTLARRIVLRVRLRDEELLRQLLGEDTVSVQSR